MLVAEPPLGVNVIDEVTMSPLTQLTVTTPVAPIFSTQKTQLPTAGLRLVERSCRSTGDTELAETKK
jgi:hypothetical protein